MPTLLADLAEETSASEADHLNALIRLLDRIRRTMEHRAREWQPADPERLAKGLQLAREGKTIKSEEARARFRHPPGSEGAA
jgi:hypothetical protein